MGSIGRRNFLRHTPAFIAGALGCGALLGTGLAEKILLDDAVKALPRPIAPHTPKQQPNTQQNRPTAEQKFEERREAAITAFKATTTDIAMRVYNTPGVERHDNGVTGNARYTARTLRNGVPHETIVDMTYGVDPNGEPADGSVSYLNVLDAVLFPNGQAVEQDGLIVQRSAESRDYDLWDQHYTPILSTGAGPSAQIVNEDIDRLNKAIDAALNPFTQG